MGTIPDGLQRHVLITMDGRTWIENVHSAGVGSLSYQELMRRGNLKEIPQNKLADFIRSLD